MTYSAEMGKRNENLIQTKLTSKNKFWILCMKFAILVWLRETLEDYYNVRDVSFF